MMLLVVAGDTPRVPAHVLAFADGLLTVDRLPRGTGDIEPVLEIKPLCYDGDFEIPPQPPRLPAPAAPFASRPEFGHAFRQERRAEKARGPVFPAAGRPIIHPAGGLPVFSKRKAPHARFDLAPGRGRFNLRHLRGIRRLGNRAVRQLTYPTRAAGEPWVSAVQAAIVPTSCRVERASIPRLDRKGARSLTGDSHDWGVPGAGPGCPSQRGCYPLCSPARFEARALEGDPAYRINCVPRGDSRHAGCEVGTL